MSPCEALLYIVVGTLVLAYLFPAPLVAYAWVQYPSNATQQKAGCAFLVVWGLSVIGLIVATLFFGAAGGAPAG